MKNTAGLSRHSWPTSGEDRRPVQSLLCHSHPQTPPRLIYCNDDGYGDDDNDDDNDDDDDDDDDDDEDDDDDNDDDDEVDDDDYQMILGASLPDSWQPRGFPSQCFSNG